MISLSPHCRTQKTVRRFIVGLLVCFTFLGAKAVDACVGIKDHPVSVNAEIGQEVTFSVVADQRTNLPVSVQWRLNGENILGALKIFREVPGTITDSYTITHAQPTNGGAYSAVVFDAECIEHTKIARVFFPQLPRLPFSDKFEERGTIQGPIGTGTGYNCDAVYVAGTPSNDNIPGGKMVWLRWIAPRNGIVTFETSGSDFDTTLGIYKVNPEGKESVTNLIPVVGDDDEGGHFTSRVRFNVAREGEEFEIGVDGYYGNCGNIILSWSNQVTTYEELPEITRHPKSQTVRRFDPVTLSVEVKPSQKTPRYQWVSNGVPVEGETRPVLFIPHVDEKLVGEYRVRVAFEDQSETFAVTSKKAQIQINEEGNSDAAAGPKLHQVADTNNYSRGPVREMVPVSGFTGTHIFSTYGSVHEPGEPDHCGQVGGSSFWFSCQPADTGTLTVDVYTPTYDSVLAVYTWPDMDTYGDLISIACSSSNPGPGHETVVFPVAGGTVYYLVVDGLGGAYGPVTLWYNFTAPPQIITDPQSQTVSKGSTAVLSVSASGVPAPAYQWREDQIIFPGQTSSSLTLTNFQAVNQRGYDVVVTNSSGAVTSSVANLYLNEPLRFGEYTLTPTGGVSLLLLGAANSNYVVQVNTNLMTTNWIPVFTNSSPYGIVEFLDTNLYLFTNRFYRAVTY